MIAEHDAIVEDELGVPRKIVAGQPVPVNLVEAYREEVGLEADDADDADVSTPKPQRHVKATKSPPSPTRRRKR